MLCTSYIAKLNKLPKEPAKIIITRFLPKYLTSVDIIDMRINATHLSKLAPSKELLLRYKQDNNWDNYVRDFKVEMGRMKNQLDILSQYLKKGNDLYLICYEKDYTHCHRYLLAQYFMQQGIEWKEY